MPKPLRVRYSRIQREVDALLSKYGVSRPPIDVAQIAEGEGLQFHMSVWKTNFPDFSYVEKQIL